MPAPKQPPSTLYDKLFALHTVREQDDGTCLLYIDRHIVHEVTSPQAFEGLRNAKRTVRRLDCTLATTDHNVPTSSRTNFKSVKTFIKEDDSRIQCETLEDNVKLFGLTYFGMADKRQGIVHIIGPEQGFTLPGTTVVCGDSHTSTHGAFGALAFGIGTSEVEHVLATQTVLQKRSKNMRVRINGTLNEGITSKDVILHTIGVTGTAGGTGSVVEFCGSVVENLSMEARMSMTNMSIEMGSRAGLIAPDETTFAYLKGRPLAPKGDEWEAAVKHWRTLKSDADAHFDTTVDIDAQDIEPTVSWGTSPQDVTSISGKVPDPETVSDPAKKKSILRALEYMGLAPNTPMDQIKVDKVFIGSCTNARIEDLRSAARVVQGRKVADHVYAMVVPGSGLIRQQAEKEGLARIFREAGFDWREAGCSMCLGMNPDMLSPQERCASTSNRNFEGRQGAGGRTHLMSPAMAAAAAVTGKLSDVRKLMQGRQDIAFEPEMDVASDEDVPHTNEAAPEGDELVEEGTDAQTESAAAPAPQASVPAGLPPFTVLKGIAAPMDISNIDTDAIIPKQFLKTIKRTGLGVALFDAWRYDSKTHEEIPSFVLNQEPYRQAKILVVSGVNFGCGSSREHAPWALVDFGIRALIGISFAEIFSNNLTKNGMLPVVLPEKDVLEIAEDARQGIEVEVDLPKQVVRRSNGKEYPFEVNSFTKHCLINGLDDISLTLQHEKDISSYESHRSATRPWLDGLNFRGKVPVEPKTATEW
ncbi:uncharacterized protein L969DRAFT_14387 [Mixia osmundae IAM 14324]|uniref:3-isopropylmalate dehydratase n=1 Tax=Mixia osmundae (strain CBS 9802 / IAM 14324 / JCM 22182 / KY 12970) TaxID=764103 RepID=G7E028_MIXOS|nr:uncharacterized protein L969DRAFT_14387 [Mixia osmundae IAM 14324]KEI42181.1 hypothetical protein L969DRAFT_14387 [Mixia osmundae IAM 14324]GAA96188.1 hypothetical protein E5Q_02852 [Mixia osmundae IAM 14324]